MRIDKPNRPGTKPERPISPHESPPVDPALDPTEVHNPTMAPSPIPSSNARRSPTSPRLYPIVADPRPAAVVIHCSDPRFQSAFEDFLEHELGLAKGEYIPIIVGGGAGVLGHPEILPKEFKFLKERLDHYYKIFPTAKRIILINHEGCRYYDALKSRTLPFMGVRKCLSPEHAREDLSLVARAFQLFLSHLGYLVEFYYAKFSDPGRTHILIEKVDA
jgi:hypothetical protein